MLDAKVNGIWIYLGKVKNILNSAHADGVSRSRIINCNSVLFWKIFEEKNIWKNIPECVVCYNELCLYKIKWQGGITWLEKIGQEKTIYLRCNISRKLRFSKIELIYLQNAYFGHNRL